MLSVQDASKVDKRTKYTVHGWLHEAEESLGLNHIPNIVATICILFYRAAEIFAVVNEEFIDLSEDKTCATKLKYTAEDCMYGKYEISMDQDGIFEWNIKIKKMVNSALLLGISTSKDTCKHAAAMSGNNYFYGADLDRHFKHGHRVHEPYGLSWISGDTISICLDLTKRELRFKHNKEDQGVAFVNIEEDPSMKYRLY